MNRKPSSILLFSTLIIIILVLIPYISSDRFRQGSENFAGPALNTLNTISHDDFQSLGKGTLLLVEGDDLPVVNNNLSIISLSSGEIENSSYLKSIRKSSAPIIISSDDPGIEARVWMILAQKGIKRIFVYSDEKETDDLSHEFRPDRRMSN